MIRRITFVEPENENLHIFSKFVLPRLGTILLATIMRDRGFAARTCFMPAREAAARRLDADLVGISTITATAPGAYALGDHFRARGIPVVFGGPHVSFLPEEALEHGDYCLTGEGEESLPMLVDALNKGTALDAVPGLVWKEKGTIRRNPVPAPIEDLDRLPFPDLGLLEMGGNRRIGAQGLARPTVPVQTSRGCPFDCTFCSVTGMFGRHYRHRSTANVLAELARYDPGACDIFFYDDNFAANPRATKELLREMIRLGLGFHWSTQVRSDIARDPEMLDLMKEAGCMSLYIGFESVDPQALREMKKNQSVDEIRHAIHEIRARKIHVHGMFVFGFDSDTPATTKATVRFALREKIDTAQFLILTPLPGTGFYTRMKDEGRLLDTSWGAYDAHHVKFWPRRFSPWELQRAQIMAHARFYAPWHVVARLLRGSLGGFFVGMYAWALNRRWRRVERDYLKALRTRVASPATV